MLSKFGLPGFEAFWSDLVALRTQTNPALRQHLTPAEYAKAQAWWDAFLTDDVLQRAPRCLVHGDLWPDNLLVDPDARRLLGVIDFGDTGVVDVAYDFAPLIHAGSALMAACRTAYERLGGVLDAGFQHRLQRWWELRSGSFFSLRASIVHDDIGELQDSLQKLRKSPILTSVRPEKW